VGCWAWTYKVLISSRCGLSKSPLSLMCNLHLLSSRFLSVYSLSIELLPLPWLLPVSALLLDDVALGCLIRHKSLRCCYCCYLSFFLSLDYLLPSVFVFPSFPPLYLALFTYPCFDSTFAFVSRSVSILGSYLSLYHSRLCSTNCLAACTICPKS